MNLKFNFRRLALAMCALGCVIFVTQADGRNHSHGQLIVQRAANFGTYVTLQMWIDGREVGDIGRGRRYNRLIPAGRHVLTVSSVPNVRNVPPTSTVVTVRPGDLYVFTATWDPDWGGVVLRASSLAL